MEFNVGDGNDKNFKFFENLNFIFSRYQNDTRSDGESARPNRPVKKIQFHSLENVNLKTPPLPHHRKAKVPDTPGWVFVAGF